MISPRRNTSSLLVERVRDGRAARKRRDDVTVEEPMEIRIALDRSGASEEHSVAVTMRTPGDDFDLAAGFLFTEGFVACRADISALKYCDEALPREYNIVAVSLSDPRAFDPSLLNRNFYMTSSCGVCGKASLEAVEVRGCAPLPDGELAVSSDVVRSVPDLLRSAQHVFERTGSIHAAALVDADGEISVLREDVGRHNALDKVIGHELLEGELPASDRFLAVSGRSSFEIMQKALVAGIPMVVAVGAPSSLAVDLAQRFNMTLIGFAKRDGYNVYAGAARVDAG